MTQCGTCRGQATARAARRLKQGVPYCSLFSDHAPFSLLSSLAADPSSWPTLTLTEAVPDPETAACWAWLDAGSLLHPRGESHHSSPKPSLPGGHCCLGPGFTLSQHRVRSSSGPAQDVPASRSLQRQDQGGGSGTTTSAPVETQLPWGPGLPGPSPWGLSAEAWEASLPGLLCRSSWWLLCRQRREGVLRVRSPQGALLQFGEKFGKVRWDPFLGPACRGLWEASVRSLPYTLLPLCSCPPTHTSIPSHDASPHVSLHSQVWRRPLGTGRVPARGGQSLLAGLAWRSRKHPELGEASWGAGGLEALRSAAAGGRDAGCWWTWRVEARRARLAGRGPPALAPSCPSLRVIPAVLAPDPEFMAPYKVGPGMEGLPRPLGSPRTCKIPSSG